MASFEVLGESISDGGCCGYRKEGSLATKSRLGYREAPADWLRSLSGALIQVVPYMNRKLLSLFSVSL